MMLIVSFGHRTHSTIEIAHLFPLSVSEGRASLTQNRWNVNLVPKKYVLYG